MSEKYGGPAFPHQYKDVCGAEWIFPGMTLRDWFAGQALPQAMGESPTKDLAATLAYQMADAMLKARVEGTTP